MMKKLHEFSLALGGASLAALVAASWIPGGIAQAASGMKLMDLLPQYRKDLLTRTLQSRCLHEKDGDPLCKALRGAGMAIPHGLPDRPVNVPYIGGQQQQTGSFAPSAVGHSAQPTTGPSAGAPNSVQPMAQPTQAPYGYANWPLPQPYCPTKYSPCPWTQPANTPWTGTAPWDSTVSAAVWYFNQAKSTPVGLGANPNVSFYGNSPFMRKFVDGLPGLGPNGKNNLGVYIPVATPNTTLFPASDYYEIKVTETQVPMHSDLVPLNQAYANRAGTKVRQYQDLASTPAAGDYPVLGPMIVAQRDRAVRIRFVNGLTPKSKLFLPVDPTIMGAGNGPSTVGGGACGTAGTTQRPYSENRADIHVHGSFSPWISDGTPHQWITPVGDDLCHPSGWAQRNVPDMAGFAPTTKDNGKNNSGEATYFHPNAQSARLEWYHDHSYGLTRLNVYAGEAAPFVLTDPIEQDYINGTNASGANPGVIKALPGLGMPLIIQDRSFVNPCMGFDSTSASATVSDSSCFSDAAKAASMTSVLLQSRDNWENDDPLWDRRKWGMPGDLWFPHSYAMNQFPPSQGLNPIGRYDYGYWMNPPWIPVGAAQKVLPAVSAYPESFMDTPTINGVAYPNMKVKRQAYRFRILNGSNDRQWNLQLYAAKNPALICPNTPPLSTDPPACAIDPNLFLTEADLGSAVSTSTNYKQIPIYMIGNESGFLQSVIRLNDCSIGACPQPTVYDSDPKSATVMSVKSREIWLAPAERADVIIDFSKMNNGDHAILYNDLKAAVPLYDARLDYNPDLGDQSALGGAHQAPTGKGPDVHNLMQFVVDDNAPDIGTSPIDPTNLGTNLDTMVANAWSCNNNGKVGATTTNCNLPVLDQQLAALPPKPAGAPVMGPNQYVGGMGAPPPAVLGGGDIPDGSWFCAPDGPYWWDPNHVVGGFYYPNNMGQRPPSTCNGVGSNGVAKRWIVVVQKDVLDGLFDNYGRMSAQLGTAAGVPANPLLPIPGMAYKDAPTEILTRNVPQVWMMFHGGVDTHVVHFHLSNVQVMNRYDIAGAMYLPDDDERGWKESVKVSPFTTTFVMVQPKLPPNGNQAKFNAPSGPGALNASKWAAAGWTSSTFPSSQRPADVTMPVTTGRNVTNPSTNFYGEYVWHCHILGHEENDMMRPVVLR